MGAWARRPGNQFAATTRNGAQGLLRAFAFNQQQPIMLEFTAGHLRMFANSGLVLEHPRAVATISGADPAVVFTPTGHPYASLDQVQFALTLLTPGNPAGEGVKPLFNRQFSITVIDGFHFSLQDPITGANIDGSVLNLAGWGISVARVYDHATPYTAAEIAANQLRLIQDEDIALICDGAHVPQVLYLASGKTFFPLPGQSTNDACFPLFNYTTATFTDGPYFDPPTDGTTLTPSGISGLSVTLSASSIASINGGLGFLSTDVGRQIRLFSEPPPWNGSTGYTKGQNVKWQNAYWQALQSSTGSQPDTSIANWAVTTAAAAWTYGLIETINSTSQVVVTLSAADPYGLFAGGALLNTTQPVLTWQLGVYSNTTGWPTGGCYHEGRFWLFGAQFNRADATMSGNGGTPEYQGLRFNPTAIDGTVADDNGISIEIQSDQVNTILWMIGTQGGIVMGSLGGEFLIRASETNDPLTPSSVQAKRVTKFGCANVEPRQLPLAIAFVDRYNARLIEYLQDPFSGRSLGFNLTINAEHFTAQGIQEIAYVQERTPIIWARLQDGSLKGCTYKRESPFGTQPAAFYGWHQHPLGSGRFTESIQAGLWFDGNFDALYMITNAASGPSAGVRWVEIASPLMSQTGDILSANFVDAGIVPEFAQISGNNVTFYGLQQMEGQSLTAWFGGVDMGDFVVSATGTLTVTINQANSLMTTAYLDSLTFNNAPNYGYLTTFINGSVQGGGFYSPFAVALPFTSSSTAPLHGNFGIFDWDRGLLYNQQTQAVGDPGTNGRSLFIFNLATQAQVAGPIDPGQSAFYFPYFCGLDGNIYSAGSANNVLVNQFNTRTFTNNTFNNTGGPTLAAAGYCCTMGRSTAPPKVLCTGLNAGANSAPYFVVDYAVSPPEPMPNLNPADNTTPYLDYFDEAPGTITAGNAFPMPGPGGQGPGCFSWTSGFVIAAISTQLGLYQIFAEGFGTSGRVAKWKIATIVPTQIDATWSAFSGVQSQVLDETDGNIIAEIENTAGATQFYLVKLNSTTGAVMWKIAIGTSATFNQSRIRGGKFSLIDVGPVLRTVDTIAGTSVTHSESAINPVNNFSTDDKSGILVAGTGDIGTVMWHTFGPGNGGQPLTPAVVYMSPAILGFNYASRGQILRRLDPQESGAQNGPSLGKTRRTHHAAFLLANSQQFYYGSDFDQSQHKAVLMTYPGYGGNWQGGTVPIPLNQLFTSVFWTAIEDPYGFDGMISWESKRPYPLTVTAVEGFLHTQDR